MKGYLTSTWVISEKGAMTEQIPIKFNEVGIGLLNYYIGVSDRTTLRVIDRIIIFIIS